MSNWWRGLSWRTRNQLEEVAVTLATVAVLMGALALGAWLSA